MTTEEEFVHRLRGILEAARDPRLHEAIWSYREGKLDRIELLTHPAYQRHVAESWDAAVAEFERQGGSIDDVRVEARRIARELGHDEVIADDDAWP